MSPFLLVELVPGVWMERIVGNRGGLVRYFWRDGGFTARKREVGVS